MPADRDWEDPRHTVAHEGGEKRERERSAISDRSEKVLYSKILKNCITVDDKYIVAETEVRCRCGISKTEGGNTRRGGDLTLVFITFSMAYNGLENSLAWLLLA